MAMLRLRINCPLQRFNRREMMHDRLRGALQPRRYHPYFDIFSARFVGNRTGTKFIDLQKTAEFLYPSLTLP